MKSGILVLAFLMIALVALPLAPYSDSTGTSIADQSPVKGGGGYAYRYGAGAGMHANNGMMRGPGPMPQGARHGREIPVEAPVQQELRRDPFDWNTPVRTIRFRAFRRLSGKNILEHEKRHLIYTTILTNPGIDVPMLASMTGINLHTLRYHVAYLMHLEKISCVEQGGRYHFFENRGKYTRADQQRILYSRYPTTDHIISAIGANPGITRGEIAVQLGLAGPSVTRWTHRLIAEGVINEVRDGRCARYYPAQDGIVACTA